MSIAGFVNFVMLKHKLEKKRYADFSLDFIVMGFMSWIMMGTVSGMAIALTISSLFSIYLWFSPPKFLEDLNFEDTLKELNVK